MTAAGVQSARRRATPANGAGGKWSHGQRRGRDQHGRGPESVPSLFDGLGGEPTLDDVLVGAWEGLTTRSVVACPVCSDDMAPVFASGARPVGGRCHGCGSMLT